MDNRKLTMDNVWFPFAENSNNDHCPLSIIHYPLSIIHYPLFIVYYPLSIIHYSSARRGGSGVRRTTSAPRRSDHRRQPDSTPHRLRSLVGTGLPDGHPFLSAPSPCFEEGTQHQGESAHRRGLHLPSARHPPPKTPLKNFFTLFAKSS